MQATHICYAGNITTQEHSGTFTLTHYITFNKCFLYVAIYRINQCTSSCVDWQPGGMIKHHQSLSLQSFFTQKDIQAILYNYVTLYNKNKRKLHLQCEICDCVRNRSAHLCSGRLSFVSFPSGYEGVPDAPAADGDALTGLHRPRCSFKTSAPPVLR